MAAEVFRKYDADGSGALDRDELLAALRDLGLLARVSAAAVGRALAEMDSNGDHMVSFEEFRAAFSRLVKLRAEEQRAARMQRAVSAIPPNAATDPRLRAAFSCFASYGAARGLAERTDSRGGGEGLTSRQFQRACQTAALPVERAAADVIFTVARKGSKVLSFPRFLDALALVAAEAAVPLERILESVRGTAPATAASPCKDVDSRLPLSARSRRPKSASKPAAACAVAGPPAASSPDGAEGRATGRPAMAGPIPGAGAQGLLAAAATSNVPPFGKLQQRIVSLQQLLDMEMEGEEAEGASTIPAHPGHQPAGQAAVAVQDAGAVGETLQVNPAFQSQSQEAGDAASQRLQLLTLVDQRCEAAEARCAALVATREEMRRALVAQMAGAVGGASGAAQQEMQAALAGYEARLAELEGRVADVAQQAVQECRAVAAAADAKLEALRRAQEDSTARINQALLAIARRVGTLAPQPAA